MKQAKAFMASCGFELPPFAHWSPEDWKDKGTECDEIRSCRLGWDITDFGANDFMNKGLLLFTLRNGTPGAGKPYAEKLMIVEKGQVTPCHFHWSKQEDIINRAGGPLKIQVWPSDDQEQLAEGTVEIPMDGVLHTFQAGHSLSLAPGESITLNQRVYHKFWAEESRCLVGEVSAVNDDHEDNRFLHPQPRFSNIKEDEPPLHHLCNEYPAP